MGVQNVAGTLLQLYIFELYSVLWRFDVWTICFASHQNGVWM